MKQEIDDLAQGLPLPQIWDVSVLTGILILVLNTHPGNFHSENKI